MNIKSGRGQTAGILVLTLVLLLSGRKKAQDPVVASAPPLPTAITVATSTLPAVSQERQLTTPDFNTFGLNLFKGKASDQNWAVAPVGVALSLAQMLPGAQGETAAQMKTALAVDQQLEQLSVDELWASIQAMGQAIKACAPESFWAGWAFLLGEGPTVKVSFLNLLEQTLGTQTTLVDYQSGQYDEVYSAWVKQASGGLITALTGVPQENAPLVLASVAAYDGKWAKAFNEKNIRNASFTTDAGQKVNTAMMTTKAAPPLYARSDATLAVMPLDQNMEAWLLMPPEGVSLREFVASLTVEKLTTWRSQAVATSCLITVPQIDLIDSSDLTSVLGQLGVQDAFDPAKADFADVGEKISVSHVLSAARVRLGAAGVDTADEPMSQRMLRGMDRDQTSYSFNRPFMLIITPQNSDTILLMAGITTPMTLEEEKE